MAAGILLLLAAVGPPQDAVGPPEPSHDNAAQSVTVQLDAGTMGWALVMTVLLSVILVFIGWAKRSA